MSKIISAESVCEGHPDKLCDLIADGILDACLMVDPFSRCACEVLATKGLIVVAGEITCKENIDYKSVVKKVLGNVGYDDSEFKIQIKIHNQSPDIDGGVTKSDGELGAGDQGVVYGYACDETDEMLPLPVVLANRITRQIDIARHWNNVKGLLPDGKCLVGIEYENGKAKRIDSVVISMQHDERVTNAKLKDFFNFVIAPNVFTDLPIDYKTKILINPSGRFVVGGPAGDTGLTGRKLMCDTYGGIAHHGGGAFSGKDATKVDRSAAYYARYVAKNVVAAGLAKKCEVCITYAIGKEEPVSVQIDTFGTGNITVGEIENAVMKTFDFRPKAIIEQLKLREPNFTLTTCHGHFGKSELSYEQTNKVTALLEVIRNG
jgi:S-adenosylmethionine synthetase